MMEWKAEHWLGLIGVVATFGAAIGGALIGGTVANNGAQQVEESQVRHAQERDLRAARAVARLLVLELRGVRERVGAAGGATCWSADDYHVDLAADDRRLLAAQLPAEGWADVMRAYRLADRVAVHRRDGFTWRPNERSPDMELTLEVLSNYDSYIAGLSAFARIPDVRRSEESPTVKRYRTAARAPADARTPAQCRRR